jgi:prepilin-type N-terminal cleavage/methylation domain-containing protein
VETATKAPGLHEGVRRAFPIADVTAPAVGQHIQILTRRASTMLNHYRTMLNHYRKVQEERAQGDEEGFTLIELLIVIIVLGILAAVTVFGLSNVTTQSAQSACHADAKSVEVAVEAFHAQNGRWPVASTAAGDTDLTPTPGPGVVSYLRTWPNSTHYTISTDGNGKVSVGTTDFDTLPNPCDAVT